MVLPDTKTSEARGVDLYLKELAVVLQESTEELVQFSTPEEGFFYAVEMVCVVMEKLGKQAERDLISVPPTLLLARLLEILRAALVRRQSTVIAQVSHTRDEKRREDLIARLEQIEEREDVDLTAVKARAGAILQKMAAHNGLDIIETGVKANIV